MKSRNSIFMTIVLTAIVVATLGISTVPSEMQTLSDAQVKFTVNGEAKSFKNELFLKDGVTYVPLRECAEEWGFQVEWNEKDRQIEVDTDHKVVPDLVEAEVIVEQGVIPDEETALAVGKAILEAAMGRSMVYQDGERELRLTAYYYEGINAWIVYQTGRYEGRMWYGTNLHRPYVVINKNTGEVISIDLYPQAELRTPLGRHEDGSPIYPSEA